MENLNKEQKIAEAALKRKKNDIQIAVATILSAVTKNPPARSLLQPNYLPVVENNYALWCPLLEQFAEEPPPSAKPQNKAENNRRLQAMQKDLLGFVPDGRAFNSRDAKGAWERLTNDANDIFNDNAADEKVSI